MAIDAKGGEDNTAKSNGRKPHRAPAGGAAGVLNLLGMLNRPGSQKLK